MLCRLLQLCRGWVSGGRSPQEIILLKRESGNRRDLRIPNSEFPLNFVSLSPCAAPIFVRGELERNRLLIHRRSEARRWSGSARSRPTTAIASAGIESQRAVRESQRASRAARPAHAIKVAVLGRIRCRG